MKKEKKPENDSDKESISSLGTSRYSSDNDEAKNILERDFNYENKSDSDNESVKSTKKSKKKKVKAKIDTALKEAKKAANID